MRDFAVSFLIIFHVNIETVVSLAKLTRCLGIVWLGLVTVIPSQSSTLLLFFCFSFFFATDFRASSVGKTIKVSCPVGADIIFESCIVTFDPVLWPPFDMRM